MQSNQRIPLIKKRDLVPKIEIKFGLPITLSNV